MYGGVSAIEMGPQGIVRKEWAVDSADFNERIVLAYTGAPRNSGINNWEVMKGHIDGDRAIHRNFERITAIANSMRGALERNDWNDVGRLLREEWSNRRKNAPAITTELIDRLIATTRRVGSTGAKVCGAGGGGCVFFLVEPDSREKVTEVIRSEGAQVLERGRIAGDGLAAGHFLQQPSHDLAAARFRQRFGEPDLVGLGDRANVNTDVRAQFFLQLVAHHHATFHGNECHHALTL